MNLVLNLCPVRQTPVVREALDYNMLIDGGTSNRILLERTHVYYLFRNDKMLTPSPSLIYRTLIGSFYISNRAPSRGLTQHTRLVANDMELYVAEMARNGRIRDTLGSHFPQTSRDKRLL